MKYNLKNRIWEHGDLEEIRDWFSGFEKELRERFINHTKKYHWTELEDLIKEILGE